MSDWITGLEIEKRRIQIFLAKNYNLNSPFISQYSFLVNTKKTRNRRKKEAKDKESSRGKVYEINGK